MTVINAKPEPQQVHKKKKKYRPGRLTRSQAIASAVFLSGAFVLFVLFFLWPGALSLYYSLTDYRGVGTPNFIGIENYQTLFQDAAFAQSFKRTFVYAALAVPAMYVASLSVAAVLTTSHAKGKATARVLVFLPWLISPIVTGVIWRWLFGENFGFVNFLLTEIGLNPQKWQTDPTLALLLIVIVGTWGGTAFNMLLFMTALRNIPQSYLEAAQLDGANAWLRFRKITLPLLAPTSFMVILLSTIGSIKEFAMVQALNAGGPGTQNMLMVQYIYRTGFERAQIGYASAASMVLLVVLVTVALIQMRFDRKSDLS